MHVSDVTVLCFPQTASYFHNLNVSKHCLYQVCSSTYASFTVCSRVRTHRCTYCFVFKLQGLSGRNETKFPKNDNPCNNWRGVGEVSEPERTTSPLLKMEVLDFRQVPLFWNHNPSKATGVEIQAKFRTFCQFTMGGWTLWVNFISLASAE